MAQYQVDSEQIQSSSAAVNASIQAIRQSAQGMYANLNIDSACAFASVHALFGNRNAGVASIRTVAADASDTVTAVAGTKKKRSLPPSWEAGSAYSFSLMPLGFTEPLDQ